MNTSKPSIKVPAPNTPQPPADEVGQEPEEIESEIEHEGGESEQPPAPEITPEEDANGTFEIVLGKPITLDKHPVSVLRFSRPTAGHRLAGIRAVGESNLTLLFHAVAVLVGSGEVNGRFRPLTQAAYNELSWLDSVRIEKKFIALCGF